jgi:hypothetical protein
LDIATRKIFPAPRSMTGVEVTPIVGKIWSQPTGSLGVSPESSSEDFHSVAPVSASKAYTESASVATYTTLCGLPPTVSWERYRGCASTVLSTGRVCSSPKEVMTFAGVSAVSDGLRPVRATS